MFPLFSSHPSTDAPNQDTPIRPSVLTDGEPPAMEIGSKLEFGLRIEASTSLRSTRNPTRSID
ncbi:MAG: hypothetical protein IPO40_02720 [Fibrobacteres bacterium]|nr:hypothetical protein [Fibrobacterota bacterium]